MNRTNMPPKKIKNKIYENQNDRLERPVQQQIRIVWRSRLKPIASGWEIWVNKIAIIRVIGYNIIKNEISKR